MKITTLLIFVFFSSLFCEKYKVLYVVDGDTFDVDLNRNGKIEKKKERVRLLGVDTFETRRDKRLKEQAKYWNMSINEALQLGKDAKKFAIDQLLKKDVKLDKKGRDRYNRLLAYVVVDNKDFGSMLLKSGLAAVYRKNKKHKNYKLYDSLEKDL